MQSECISGGVYANIPVEYYLNILHIYRLTISFNGVFINRQTNQNKNVNVNVNAIINLCPNHPVWLVMSAPYCV